MYASAEKLHSIRGVLMMYKLLNCHLDCSDHDDKSFLHIVKRTLLLYSPFNGYNN